MRGGDRDLLCIHIFGSRPGIPRRSDGATEGKHRWTGNHRAHYFHINRCFDRSSRRPRDLVEREIPGTIHLVLRLRRRRNRIADPQRCVASPYDKPSRCRLAFPRVRIGSRAGLLVYRRKTRWPRAGLAPSPRQFRDRLAEFVDFVGLAQNGKIAAHVQRGVAVAAGQEDRQSGPDRLQVAR